MAQDKPFKLFTSLRYDSSLVDVPQSNFDNAGWNFKNASPMYMLDLHRDRLLRAATHWDWPKAISAIRGKEGLQRLAEFVSSVAAGKGDEPLRVKVTLSREGELGYEISVVPKTALPNLFPPSLPPPESDNEDAGNDRILRKTPMREIILDSGRTARSEHTHFKTTERTMYDDARQRVGIQGPEWKEVLIVHGVDGLIMEGSTTTPYFWRNNRWVTPPVSPFYSAKVGSGGQDGTTRRFALENGLALEEEVKAASVADGEECWLSNGVRGFMWGKIRLAPSSAP